MTAEAVVPLIRRLITQTHSLFMLPMPGERARPALPRIFGLAVAAEAEAATETTDEQRPQPITPANSPVTSYDWTTGGGNAGDSSGEPISLAKAHETATEFLSYLNTLTMLAMNDAFADVLAELENATTLPVDTTMAQLMTDMEVHGIGGQRAWPMLLCLLMQVLLLPIAYSRQMTQEERTLMRTEVFRATFTGRLSCVTRLLRLLSSDDILSRAALNTTDSESPENEAQENNWRVECWINTMQLLTCWVSHGMLALMGHYTAELTHDPIVYYSCQARRSTVEYRASASMPSGR